MYSANYVKVVPFVGTLALTTTIMFTPVNAKQMSIPQPKKYVSIQSELSNYTDNVIQLTIFESIDEAFQDVEYVIPLEMSGILPVVLSKLNKIDFDWI